MLWIVYVLNSDGSANVLAQDVTSDVAESIARHPSLGGRAVVVPSFVGVVV